MRDYIHKNMYFASNAHRVNRSADHQSGSYPDGGQLFFECIVAIFLKIVEFLCIKMYSDF
jgi:hypothetical protein